MNNTNINNSLMNVILILIILIIVYLIINIINVCKKTSSKKKLNLNLKLNNFESFNNLQNEDNDENKQDDVFSLKLSNTENLSYNLNQIIAVPRYDNYNINFTYLGLFEGFNEIGGKIRKIYKIQNIDSTVWEIPHQKKKKHLL